MCDGKEGPEFYSLIHSLHVYTQHTRTLSLSLFLLESFCEYLYDVTAAAAITSAAGLHG